ncbi:MAG: hypothetical protein KA233_07020 [Novosphingobium sp.]|nr:hypothetical protein [Novosphingobium sp.]MBP6555418.1 hypothetical protein [Novosphingobium sp.]
MKPLWKLTALAAVAMSQASPALADAAFDQLEQGTYYAQLAASSIDLANRGSARKEKCKWVRQSRAELTQAQSHYESAERLAQNSSSWTPQQRVRLGELVTKTRGSLEKTDELIRQLC